MDPLSSITNSGYAAAAQTDSTGKAAEGQLISGTEQSTPSAASSGIRLPEDTVTLSGKQPDKERAGQTTAAPAPSQAEPASAKKTSTASTSAEDPAIQAQITRLKQIEEKVKAHEAAHKAVGGNLASSASYSYTRGPDGRSYITGGEVQIDMSDGKTPQETISRMQQVIRAALAPSDPSGQDRAVAAAAASRMAEAQQQKMQTDGPTAKQDPAQPVDPAKEAIENALNPEGTDATSSKAGGKARDSRIQDAYGDPAVQGTGTPSFSSFSPSQSNRFAGDTSSLISSFA